MAEWMVETCYIAACRLVGSPEDVVCVQVHGLNFRKPATNGDIIDIRAKVAFVGSTSITIHNQVFINEEKTASASGMATFVTVDKDGRPYAHGLSLPEEYIAQNREIYEEALRTRELK
jgi:acyl-CoA hydrolase